MEKFLIVLCNGKLSTENIIAAEIEIKFNSIQLFFCIFQDEEMPIAGAAAPLVTIPPPPPVIPADLPFPTGNTFLKILYY